MLKATKLHYKMQHFIVLIHNKRTCDPIVVAMGIIDSKHIKVFHYFE